jgi:hypothetical protein
MKSVKVYLAIASVVGVTNAQTLLDLRSQVKNVHFSRAAATKPFKSGAALPATCSIGEEFFDTSAAPGNNWYACTATNVWTQQGGGVINGDVSGPASAATVTAIQGKPISSTAPNDGAVLRWSGADAQWAPVVDTGAVVTSTQLRDLSANVDDPNTLSIGSGTWGAGTSTFNIPGVTANIRSIDVTGATNATPIVLSVGSTNGLHNGDSITVAGVQGNPAANGTWSIIVYNATQIELQGSAGSGAYTGGGKIAGTGSGTAYIYANESGSITIEHSSSAALVLSCTGKCITNQVIAPSFAASSSPVAVATISNGVWASVEDRRRFMSSINIVAGLGIAVDRNGGQASIAIDSSVPRLGGTNVWLSDNSFTAATRTAPCRTGNGAPAAQRGTTGDCYFQSDAAPGQNLWFATTTGTPANWTQPQAIVGPTGVSAGVYRNATLTISADGRISNASAGVGAGSGMLDWQKRRTDQVVNTTSDTTLFTTSIPARTIQAGRCVRISSQFQQQYSAAPYDYKLWIGSTSITVAGASTTQTVLSGNFLVCNDPASTNSQQITSKVDWATTSSTGTIIRTAAEDTTAPLVFKVTARAVSGTPNNVTPWGWLVELVQ